jgi:hypothetical protein
MKNHFIDLQGVLQTIRGRTRGQKTDLKEVVAQGGHFYKATYPKTVSLRENSKAKS